tara:strand:- start:1047 stop:1943 length:897 start_codon:yes stop_codon:yes gene_type:complete
MPKKAELYICEECDFKSSKKSNYDTHLTTAKHINRTNRTEKKQKDAKIFQCDCGKVYKARNSYWYHKKRCIIDNEDINNNLNEKDSVDSSLVLELLKENKEIRAIMAEQNKQMIELAKNSGNTTNNTITNNNNNRFNLNVFLNETCKDAITLNDFIQSIELNTDDFIRTGENGFVKGISHVMVERIRGMDPHIRPIHCTDLKRETVYVKDTDKWEKEDSNMTQLRKAVKVVANKNQQQLYPWQAQNPNFQILNTPECEKFFDYSQASLGGYGEEEDEKFENKIIHNVLKEVVIDKTLE